MLEVDREREKRAEEHALEIRVYSQKVRHLEYEAKNTAKRLNADSAAEIEAERDGHRSRDMSLHESKMSLRAQLRAQEKANAEAISRLRGEHERRLRQRKNEFEQLLQNLRQRYEERLTTMKADLALRHKVEVRLNYPLLFCSTFFLLFLLQYPLFRFYTCSIFYLSIPFHIFSHLPFVL